MNFDFLSLYNYARIMKLFNKKTLKNQLIKRKFEEICNIYFVNVENQPQLEKLSVFVYN